MTDHDAARARAAESAHPDRSAGRRPGMGWGEVAPTLPPRDTTNDRAWMARANCLGLDPDLFHPEKGMNGHTVAEAKAVCQSCEVVDDCLNFALDHNEDMGIWGGLAPKERRAVIRSRGGNPRLKPIPHGTQTGYVLERRRGLPTCALCREAHSQHERLRRLNSQGEAS